MSKGQVLVLGFGVAEEVCVIVCGSYLQWGWFAGTCGLGSMPFWIACSATWDHGNILTQNAAKDHVWVHGPAVSEFWPMLSPCATGMPRVWTMGCDHVGIQWLCCH